MAFARNYGSADVRPHGTVNKIGGSAKRMPLVFCLDVTGSMLWATEDGVTSSDHRRIDLLNQVIGNCWKHIMKYPKAAATADVAFVVFGQDILLETEFISIRRFQNQEPDLQIIYHERDAKLAAHCGFRWDKVKNANNEEVSFSYPVFDVPPYDRGTNISGAVARAVDKLDARRMVLGQGCCYPPFLVLISDGNPDIKRTTDPNHDKACELVLERCQAKSDKMIIPLVVGVGGADINMEVLRDYSAGFANGLCRISNTTDQDRFDAVSNFICNSITNSIRLNDPNLFGTISTQLNKLNR